jgi:DNA-binding MarR family transcriptional regulator
VTAADHDHGLPATVRGQSFAPDPASRRVGLTCRTAAAGRRAVRALAEWAQRFDLGETEFQILWGLKWCAGDGLDQATLAKRLACSPAQVSTTVEQLRLRGWIAQLETPGDRRRHRWQLSPLGKSLVDQMLSAAADLRAWELEAESSEVADDNRREVAA